MPRWILHPLDGKQKRKSNCHFLSLINLFHLGQPTCEESFRFGLRYVLIDNKPAVQTRLLKDGAVALVELNVLTETGNQHQKH